MYRLLGQVFNQKGELRTNQYLFNFEHTSEIDNVGLVVIDNLFRCIKNGGFESRLTAMPSLPATMAGLLNKQHDPLKSENEMDETIASENHFRFFRISANQYEDWLSKSFSNWLARALYISSLVVAPHALLFKGIFENVEQYAGVDWVSISCSYNPEQSEVSLIVADAGIGIPSMVREYCGETFSDEVAIAKAIETICDTSAKEPRRGEGGLGKLIRKIVDHRLGRVVITSGFGRLHCYPTLGGKVHRFEPANAFLPGTLIEIIFSVELLGYATTLNEPLSKVDFSLK